MDPKLGVIVQRASSSRGPKGLELYRFKSVRDILEEEEERKRRLEQEEEEGTSPGLPHAQSSPGKPQKVINDHHEADEDHAEQGESHHEVPRHKTPFYRTPRARYKWGQHRLTRHVESSQLFFDLIYVGVSFQSGSLLGEKLSWENGFFFLATILPLYSAWYSRLSFDAMLEFGDNFHKFVFLLQGLLLGLAAHQLTSASDLESFETGNAYGFAACMLIQHLIIFSIWFEIYLFENKENVWRYAFFGMSLELIPVLFFTTSIIMIANNVRFKWVALVWFFSYVVSRACVQVIVLQGKLKRENSIPWDVAYVITRWGQFTMLMLGEGVLQIIIIVGDSVDVLAPRVSPSHVAVFFLSFVLLGLLQLLHFTTLPFNANDHVLFQGPKQKAVAWVETYAFYAVALVACGVSVKNMVKLNEKLHPELLGANDPDFDQYHSDNAMKKAKDYEKKKETYYWFLAGSLAFTTLLLAIQQLLQVDIGQELGIRITNEEEKPGTRRKLARKVQFYHGHERKRIWFFRLLLMPAVFLPLSQAKIDPVYVVLIADVLLLFLLIFDIARGRFKRKRKLNRTVAVIIAVGKLKRFIKLRRAERLAEAALRKLDTDHQLSLQEAESLEIDGAEQSAESESTGTARQNRSRSNSQGSQISTGSRRGSLSSIGNSAKAIINLGTRKVPRKKRSRISRIREFLRETQFFIPLRQRLDWENLHTSHELEWSNLFFDLVIVGLLFRLNAVAFNEFRELEAGTVALYAFEASAVLDCWTKHNVMQASFASADVFHRVLSIVQFSLVAFLSSEVLVSSDLLHVSVAEYSSYLYAFATAKILFDVSMLCLVAEIYYHHRNSGNTAVVGTSKRMALQYLMGILIYSVTFVTVAQENDILATVILWGLPHYVFVIALMIAASFRLMNNKNTVPVDIGFLAHRESELGIIALGEGVLSIIIAPVIQEADHYGAFCVGFFVLAMTKAVYFFIQRFDPSRMGSRKSRFRGLIIVFFQPIFLISLSAVGGLSVATRVEFPDFNGPSKKEYLYHALPLMLTVSLLFFFDFAHEGKDELVMPNKELKLKRAFIYVGKAFCVGFFPVIVFLDVNGPEQLTIDLVILFIVFILHAMHRESRNRALRLKTLQELEQGKFRPHGEKDKQSPDEFVSHDDAFDVRRPVAKGMEDDDLDEVDRQDVMIA